MANVDIGAITGYHAHVYYDADCKHDAARLRAEVESAFDVEMGRWHDKPVGPHPMWSYQIAFEPALFGTLVPWLILNRRELIVFVHPLTDDIIAPNLILAKERLRPEWMLEWMIDPQTVQPGTKMPNFFSFNEDDDFNPIYTDADAHTQYKMIVAIRDYLMILGTEAERQLDAQ